MVRDRRLFLVLAMATVICGCVHSKPAYLADGRQGYAIKCGSITSSWTACMVRAGKICRRHGYVVTYSDEVNRELLVACKAGVTPN